VSIVYRDRVVVVNSSPLSKHLEKRDSAVPVFIAGRNGLSTPLSISPFFCPWLSLRSVYHGLPYQKGSASRRLLGAVTVHCGVSHRDVRGATDDRSGLLGSCWGSHHPGPAVTVGNPSARNDCFGHTADRAWAVSLGSTHASRIVPLEQFVRRVTVKDGAFVEARSVSRHDRRQSIYPTAHTSPHQRPNTHKP